MGNCISNDILTKIDSKTKRSENSIKRKGESEEEIVDEISQNKELESVQMREMNLSYNEEDKEKNTIKQIFDKKILFSPKAKHRIFSSEFKEDYYIQD